MGLFSRLTVGTAMTALMATSGPALANPLDGVVSAGSATISSAGNTLTVKQSTGKAVIDWRKFDIDANETTQFVQPNSKSITLNRVGGNTPSAIMGTISANGNVVIVNPNGVVFGKTSKVDVNGLVATTADISNANFMAGKMKFDKAGKADAAIINQGSITAKEAGLVGFVAPRVENQGVITANVGRVQLASGDKMTLDFYGDKLMEVGVSDAVQNQLVSNTGTIIANGGQIALTAAAGKHIVNSLIVAKGELKAAGVSNKNGRILIYAEGSNAVAGNIAANKGKKTGSSTVVVDASMDVSGTKGGTIQVLGDSVTLADNTRLNANGVKGGGTVNIGGEYQGKGKTATANTVNIARGAVITADATSNGNGGTVTVWSDDRTDFLGRISATGGALKGNGGFVETSGHNSLLFDGMVDTSAVRGEFGTLLLDPTDITISNAANSASMSGTTASGTTTYTDTTLNSSNLNVTTLETQLATNNVVITTVSTRTGNGDITVVDPITWSAAKNLTLTAVRDININASITATNAGAAGITMTAGRNLTQQAGTTIATGGTGALSLRAANGTATNTGLLTLNGTLNVGTGNFTLLSGVDGVTAAGTDAANRISASFDSSNLQFKGATINDVSITGYRDITFTRSLSTSGTINLTAYRNLTVADVTGGVGTSTFVLRAANNSVTAIGLLTLNGNLAFGNAAGAVTLTSGTAADGVTRNNQTFTTTNWVPTGGTTGALTVSGFGDTTFNRSLASTGSIAITSYGNLTVGDITTVSASALRLDAAGGLAANIGQLILNGILNLGTGALTLTSGTDGTAGANNRRDLLFNNTNFSLLSPNIAGLNISGFRDITVSQNVTTVGSQLKFVAYRDLNVSSDLNAGTNLSLMAAGNDATQQGWLNVTGKMTNGTGTLTLTSGVDASGARRDMTFNTANFANAGSMTITGFRDMTFADAVTATGNVLLTADRHLTLGDFTVTAGSVRLQAANASAAGIGLLTLNGNLNLGTGLITLISGTATDGTTRRDQVLNSTNFVLAPTVGVVSIDGFRDLTISRDIISSGNIVVTAYRDFTINSTLASGATAGLVLKAAGGSTTARGQLILGGGGILKIGSASASQLMSGTDASGNGRDITFTNSNFMAALTNMGGLGITGFRDVVMNSSFTSSAGDLVIAATRDLTVNGNYSGARSITLTAGRDLALAGSYGTSMTGPNGNITVTAGRDLRLTGALTSAGGNTMRLDAGGGGATANLGVVSINGVLTVGNGTVLTINSGTNGNAAGAYGYDNRADITFTNSNLLYASGAQGSINLTGFRDIAFNRDLAFNSSNPFSVTALRNLSVSNVTGGNAGDITLRAAGGSASGRGWLNINGTISAPGTKITLFSGQDESGVRRDMTFDATNWVASAGTHSIIVIDGFRDLTFTTDVVSSGGVTLNAQRNLTVAGVKSGTTSAMNLKAGLAADDVGLLTINGLLRVGSGGLAMDAGTDGTTSPNNRRDLVLNSSNFQMINGSLGGTTAISGFRDITVDTDLVVSGTSAFSLTAMRDLIINSNITGTGSGAISLYAANNTVNTLGQLFVNGIIYASAGNLNINSGLDSAGNAQDLVFDNTHFQYAPGNTKFGALSITGFRDVTVPMNLEATAGIKIVAQRNLTLNSVTTGPSNSLTLQAAGGDANGTGQLSLNGPISAGSHPTGVTLTSGKDSAGNRGDLTLDSTNFTMLNGYVGPLVISGFRDITVNMALISNSFMQITAYRDLTINRDITVGAVNGLTLNAAQGDVNGIGQLRINSVLNVGNSYLTLISGHDGSGNRGDLVLTGSNLVQNAYNHSAVSIGGFRDITINTPLISYSNMTIRAVRNLTIGASGSLTGMASGTTERINLEGAHFFNYAGASGLSSTVPWRIYTISPTGNQYGGIAADNVRYNCSYGTCGAIGPITNSNVFAYSYSPVLTVTPSTRTEPFNSAINFANYGYTISGYFSGDAGRDHLTGSVSYTSPYTAGSAAGTYAVNLGSGSLVSEMGYTIQYAPSSNVLTIIFDGSLIPGSVQHELQSPETKTPPVAKTPSASKAHTGKPMIEIDPALANELGIDGETPIIGI